MDVHFFRLWMLDAGTLFVKMHPNGDRMSREDWLHHFFSHRQSFIHYTKEFVFVPEARITPPDKPYLLFGWVARQTRQMELTPPDEGLVPTEHLAWKASFIAIDPTEHADGQKIVLEDEEEIGRPRAVLGSLVRAMNEIRDAPFETQVFPVVENGSFWQFAEQHNNSIRSLTFDVPSPNMFNDANDFQEELRSLNKQENVSAIKATLESNTSLNHTTDRIKDIVDYTERGAGTLSAKAVDGETYNSQDHNKRMNLEVEHPSKSLADFFRQIINLLDMIF